MEVLNMRNEVIDHKTINWKKYSLKYFPFRLRQRDGSENTLGVLKFMFSSPYGIYLHDTNSHGLFKKQNRWLSHGCIRLEKARELAELICETSAENFNRDSLDHYISIKTRQQVNIKPSIPIHIRYFTIEADSNNFNFYKDAYQIDSMMNEVITTKQKIAQ
jgi:murein L,D-transpeptidase YcbB/YkuD